MARRHWLIVYEDGLNTTTCGPRDRHGRDTYVLAASPVAYDTRSARDADCGGRGKSAFRRNDYQSSGLYKIAKAAFYREVRRAFRHWSPDDWAKIQARGDLIVETETLGESQ